MASMLFALSLDELAASPPISIDIALLPALVDIDGARTRAAVLGPRAQYLHGGLRVINCGVSL
ncbi:hypothetical protein AWB67_06166 [Caballeronia terrestris]|uniref:Uncharacterized protein n=1 Tax=Caballeronia terrestris TaxID=1226301 RepID=A0A158KN87_9BURK|nr:hypothetical protein [Caballeronia terrestris]SAL82592.1 hypothetical protein AWB67_06166 [Caballeronia terrestris]